MKRKLRKRCRLCGAPLEGLSFKIMYLLFGHKASDEDSNICIKCHKKIEHRQFERFLVQYETGLRHFENEDFALAHTQDISEGGAKVESKMLLIKGKAVHLKLFLEHLREYIDLVGSVIWYDDSKKDKFTCGIEFKYLNPYAKQRLKSIIEEARKIKKK
ncbi:MAG: PilZ domain-containing protein [Candidatus Gygaella obscura]|nr:PilZ domain-containing protein [Candidatus Gygaella obscura]